MDLLLVRHGVSEHNTSDVISGGTSNPNLSQAGVKQVEEVSKIIDNNKIYFSSSSSQNNWSKVLPKHLQMDWQRERLGLYFPASIKPIVCLVTPTASAKSPCVISSSTRASFNFKFLATSYLLYNFKKLRFFLSSLYHIIYIMQYISVILCDFFNKNSLPLKW